MQLSVYKRLITATMLAASLLTCSAASAQITSLPLHAATQQITAAEYFFDTDPGYGNGLSFPVTVGTDITNSYSVDISGLSKGAHKLYTRTRNGAGMWSMTETLTFVTYTMVNALPALTSGSSSITAAEYFVDADPGMGNGIPITLPATGTDITASNVAVDISGLTLGLHNVYFRTRNADGKWSLGSGSKFTLIVGSLSSLPVHSQGKLVTTLEYFVDTDPGYGAGTIMTVSPTTDLAGHTFAVDISGLADGTHTLFARSLNGLTLTTAQSFEIGGIPLPVKWVSVDGRLLPGDSVQINWRTGEERECLDYVTERSVEGVVFKPLGNTACQGASATDHSYSYIDRDPKQGLNYYRIKQRDISGKVSYSPVITIRLGGTYAEVRINNPVTNTLKIVRLGDAAESAKLAIYNTAGVEVMQIPASGTVQDVDVSNLPVGMYMVRWTAAGEGKVVKFVKQ